MENILVPEQSVGSQMDIASETVCASLEEAIVFYQVAKKRLFNVNSWDDICGTEATCFQLTDSNGKPINDLAVGCLIRIDIPGPGTTVGDGYDWVRIEKISEQTNEDIQQWIGFIVRPCPNPANPELGTAHFFSDAATSTFMVSRSETKIKAEMHGRNEVPNGESDRIFDGLRNAMVGWTAKVGLSFPQWQLLVDGLVKKEM